MKRIEKLARDHIRTADEYITVEGAYLDGYRQALEDAAGRAQFKIRYALPALTGEVLGDDTAKAIRALADKKES